MGGTGLGLVLWFLGDGEFVGFSATIGAGGGGGGVAGSKTRTLTIPAACPEPPAPTPVIGPPGKLASPAKVTVVSGDTLWALADLHLGDPLRYRDIADLNDTVTNPDLIYPGQVLALPGPPQT